MKKIIRVFPRRTLWTPDDDLAFVGPPTLFIPREDLEVHVSVVFTWDTEYGYQLQRMWSLFFSDVKIGGPALDNRGEEFEPGKYIKKGAVITSRGCLRACPWCFVPKREGKIRELEIKAGWNIQDNNLLACSKKHILKVFEMLSKQRKYASFNGGLDVKLLKKWHVEQLQSINIDQMFFACDSKDGLEPLKKAARLLKDFPQKKKRCYVMIGYGHESIEEAELRLKKVYDLGFYPFSQLYQASNKKEYDDDWRELNRYWSQPCIFQADIKNGGSNAKEEDRQDD